MRTDTRVQFQIDCRGTDTNGWPRKTVCERACWGTCCGYPPKDRDRPRETHRWALHLPRRAQHERTRVYQEFQRRSLWWGTHKQERRFWISANSSTPGPQACSSITHSPDPNQILIYHSSITADPGDSDGIHWSAPWRRTGKGVQKEDYILGPGTQVGALPRQGAGKGRPALQEIQLLQNGHWGVHCLDEVSADCYLGPYLLFFSPIIGFLSF